MELPLLFLIVHGMLGGADIIINHEFKAHLPHTPSAVTEELLHSVREFLFTLLFIALAWFAWQGFAALFIVLLIVLEFGVTTVDAVVEDRTRRLTVLERINHILLLINSGVFLATLVPVLAAWTRLPTALPVVDHGWKSITLTAFAVAALAWSARDAICYLKLKDAQPHPGYSRG